MAEAKQKSIQGTDPQQEMYDAFERAFAANSVGVRVPTAVRANAMEALQSVSEMNVPEDAKQFILEALVARAGEPMAVSTVIKQAHMVWKQLYT